MKRTSAQLAAVLLLAGCNTAQLAIAPGTDAGSCPAPLFTECDAGTTPAAVSCTDLADAAIPTGTYPEGCHAHTGCLCDPLSGCVAKTYCTCAAGGDAGDAGIWACQ